MFRMNPRFTEPLTTSSMKPWPLEGSLGAAVCTGPKPTHSRKRADCCRGSTGVVFQRHDLPDTMSKLTKVHGAPRPVPESSSLPTPAFQGRARHPEPFGRSIRGKAGDCL